MPLHICLYFKTLRKAWNICSRALMPYTQLRVYAPRVLRPYTKPRTYASGLQHFIQGREPILPGLKALHKARCLCSRPQGLIQSWVLLRAPDSQHKVRWLNGLNYDYSKLKKEEVIYKVHKYRVLPLHTACARASARDHVTWNARTVTLPPPFEKARPRASYSIII